MKYLSPIVEQSALEIIETAEGICSKPDTLTQFLDQVRDIAEAHSLDELTT